MLAYLPQALLPLTLLVFQDDPKRLVERLTDESSEVRARAERALLDGDDSSRALLEQVARAEGDAAARAQRILRWHRLRPALPPIILAQGKKVQEGLLSSKAGTRRNTLFEFLAFTFPDLGQDEALQGLLMRVLDDPDPGLRAEVAIHLEYDPHEKAADAALGFLQHLRTPEFALMNHPEENRWADRVRNAGRRVIRTGKAKPEDILPLLKNQDEYAREVAIDVLQSLHYWAAAPAVRPLIQDTSPIVVQKAIRFLGNSDQLGDPQAYLEIIRTRNNWIVCDAARALVQSKRRDMGTELATLAKEKQELEGVARGVLLTAAAQLDPEAAETVAVHVLSGPPDGSPLFGRPDPSLHISAIEVLGQGGKPQHLDRILAACDQLEKLQVHPYLAGFVPEPVSKGIARASAPGRMEEILDHCTSDRWSEQLHHDPKLLDVMAWDVARHFDRKALGEICLRRIQNAQLSDEKRVVAGMMLGWCLYEKVLAPQALESLIGLAADKTAPEWVRRKVVDALPWNEPGSLLGPLERLARNVLKDPADVLRGQLSDILMQPKGERFRPLLWTALEADGQLAIPVCWYVSSMSGKFGARLSGIARTRLLSGKKDSVIQALQALEYLGPCGADGPMATLLESPDPEIRLHVLEVIRRHPEEAFLEPLRHLVKEETNVVVFTKCFGPLISLHDAEGLGTMLSRDVIPEGQLLTDRQWAAAIVGKREGLRFLEGPLDQIPGEALREALQALNRLDQEAARRVIARVLRDSNSAVRSAGAASIGEMKLTEFLPALRAMCVTETSDVRQAALRAVGAFDKTVWLPVWREALESPSAGTVDILVDLISERAPEELAKDVWPLLRERSDYEGARWARALDASANAAAHRAWGRLELAGEFLPLSRLARALEEKGLRVKFSPGAQRFADAPSMSWIGGSSNGSPATLSRLFARVETLGWREDIYFSTISFPGGMEIVTTEEARARWKDVFEHR